MTGLSVPDLPTLRVENWLGVSRLGDVFAARRLHDTSPVQVTVLGPSLVADPILMPRLRERVRELASVRSNAVMRLLELVEHPDGVALVSERVDGPTVEALERGDGPLNALAAVRVARGALAGACALHVLGSTHGSIDATYVVLARTSSGSVVRLSLVPMADDPDTPAPRHVRPGVDLLDPGTEAQDLDAVRRLLRELVGPRALADVMAIEDGADAWSQIHNPPSTVPARMAAAKLGESLAHLDLLLKEAGHVSDLRVAAPLGAVPVAPAPTGMPAPASVGSAFSPSSGGRRGLLALTTAIVLLLNGGFVAWSVFRPRVARLTVVDGVQSERTTSTRPEPEPTYLIPASVPMPTPAPAPAPAQSPAVNYEAALPPTVPTRPSTDPPTVTTTPSVSRPISVPMTRPALPAAAFGGAAAAATTASSPPTSPNVTVAPSPRTTVPKATAGLTVQPAGLGRAPAPTTAPPRPSTTTESPAGPTTALRPAATTPRPTVVVDDPTTLDAPGFIRSLQLSADDGRVVVAFAPPLEDGGAAITSYRVTVSPGGRTTSGPGSPLVVNGLTNGIRYSFSVMAVNGVGPSGAVSQTAIPRTTPQPPSNLLAQPDDTKVTLSFDPPASDGGSAVTTYKVTVSPGGGTVTGSSPLAVTGLTNGTKYTFSAVALNAVGPSGAATVVATPRTMPAAAKNLVATPGDASVSVSFDPPSNDGGAVVTGYKVTAIPGGKSVSGTGSPLVVSGLTNGTKYTFGVVAVNVAGPSSEATVTATPQTTPGPVGNVTVVPGLTSVKFTFDPPANDGGSPVTGYRVTVTVGSKTANGSGSPLNVTGLAPSTVFSYSIVAINPVGDGAAFTGTFTTDSPVTTTSSTTTTTTTTIPPTTTSTTTTSVVATTTSKP